MSYFYFLSVVINHQWYVFVFFMIFWKDLINKFYHLYYETYNEISHKYDKNKTAQQVQLYHFLRDISNSDVFIYLLIYILFYKGFKNKDTQNSLNDNIYMKNKKVQRYNK